MSIVSFSFLELQWYSKRNCEGQIALVDVLVAIWGGIKRNVDRWAIRIENANLGEFDDLGNGEATNEQGKALLEMTRAEIVKK